MDSLYQPCGTYLGLLGFFVSYICYRVCVYPLFLSPLRGIPGPPLSSWPLGHISQFLNTDQEPGILQRDWQKRYGSVVRFVGPVGVECVTLYTEEALHKVLVSDWMDYPRPKFLREILGLAVGFGLLTVTGLEHKQMRKAMNPAFSMTNIMAQTDMYFDTIDVLVDQMKDTLGKDTSTSGSALRIYDWASKAALDIICDTAFGYQSEALRNPDNPLTEAYERMMNLQSVKNLTMFSILLSIPGVSRFFRTRWGYQYRHIFGWFKVTEPSIVFIESLHKIREISRDILNEKLADDNIDAHNHASKKDIMSILVRMRQGETQNEYKLTDEALVDQVLTFLGAGHETTASGLSWVMWLLAKHSDVQDALRAELAPVFAATSRPTYRDLKDLPLLENVIMEGLRLYPPVPQTYRKAETSGYVDGTYIPAGTLLNIPIRAINTAEATWGPDAEQFRPSRWNETLPASYNAKYGTMSFLTGPHVCIGKTMAMAMMKAILGALVVNFDFAPAHAGQTAQPTVAITMRPADGMPLFVRARQY